MGAFYASSVCGDILPKKFLTAPVCVSDALPYIILATLLVVCRIQDTLMTSVEWCLVLTLTYES